jgi:hypothetical protein
MYQHQEIDLPHARSRGRHQCRLQRTIDAQAGHPTDPRATPFGKSKPPESRRGGRPLFFPATVIQPSQVQRRVVLPRLVEPPALESRGRVAVDNDRRGWRLLGKVGHALDRAPPGTRRATREPRGINPRQAGGLPGVVQGEPDAAAADAGELRRLGDVIRVDADGAGGVGADDGSRPAGVAVLAGDAGNDGVRGVQNTPPVVERRAA